MNKEELITTVSQYTGVPKYKVAAVIAGAMNTIMDTLARGEQVKLIGFGKFMIKERAARLGRNPKKNTEVHIPAMRKPVFIPGKDMKDAVKEIDDSTYNLESDISKI